MKGNHLTKEEMLVAIKAIIQYRKERDNGSVQVF
jgi:hypothetical protein